MVTYGHSLRLLQISPCFKLSTAALHLCSLLKLPLLILPLHNAIISEPDFAAQVKRWKRLSDSSFENQWLFHGSFCGELRSGEAPRAEPA